MASGTFASDPGRLSSILSAMQDRGGGRPLAVSEPGAVTPPEGCTLSQFAPVAPDFPYVSIQVDGGLVSNVNTKPETEAQTLP